MVYHDRKVLIVKYKVQKLNVNHRILRLYRIYEESGIQRSLQFSYP